MSFVQFNLDRLFNQSRNIFDCYVYSSDTDSILDISSYGYFEKSRYLKSSPSEWKGGIIEVKASDGFTTFKIGSDGLTLTDVGAGSSSSKSTRVIQSAEQLNLELSSDILYLIDGEIDFTGTSVNIVVPAGGLTVRGYGFNISNLTCSDDSYTLFTSAVGGSGDLFVENISISVGGLSSKVYDLVSVDGNPAIEVNIVNYNNCTSLGSINNYRQLLENDTGRFGGTPELEFVGQWNGARIDTSIIRGLSNLSSVFMAGAGLSFSGRFITNINADLPSSGALVDFSDTNIENNDSFILSGTFITRNGVINDSDAGVSPNIDEENVKSLWSANTGIPNTNKYIKGSVTSEVTTTVASASVYYPLLGTVTIERESHFDMPSNGQYRLLSGSGSYQISGDFTLESDQNDEVILRVTKSTDGGLTFPTEINHIKRTINNLSGPRNVGFFPVNFITNLAKDEVVRVEVENITGANNITAEEDSYLIISAL